MTDLRPPPPATGDDPAEPAGATPRSYDADHMPAAATPRAQDSTGPRALHPAWIVAGVGFVALLGAAAFRSVPSVLIDPLHAEFGWSHATISAAVSLNMLLYGLISPFAAVPPTVLLCRELFGAHGPIAFGWVFAAHQVGAAIAATGAGVIRDVQGSYDLAWYLAGALCGVAALMSMLVRRPQVPAS
ncbi:hypothetical protein ACFXK0_17740 [Nocardia sp. NPDC059177]|uniref:hypothetical protein n=1 Tax=Nocardia sp. NPDC059177 TaxID=3346759 RepID=UPI00368A1961